MIELVAIELDHRLDGHAQEVLGADAPGYGSLDRAIGAAHRLGIGQVESNPADVGLVRDRLGIQLQDRGVAEFRREGHGLLFRGGDPGRHDGDAVQREQRLRFGLAQEGPTRGQDGGDQVLGPGAIGAAVLAAGQLRRLVQAADVLAELPHAVEGAGGGVGVGERRDAAAVQDRFACRNLVPPIQLASTGLSAMVQWAFNWSAITVGSIIDWGVKITSRPSVFGSRATTSSALT